MSLSSMGPADSVYTVLRDGRLVALLRGPRAEESVEDGRRMAPKTLALPYASLHLLDARAAAALKELAAAAETLDALLFSLKLEGFTVESGPPAFGPHLRRF